MGLRAKLSAIGGTVVVIGGANTDIVGLSDAALIQSDSNPGHVRVSAGGVGRNIAENLARLGVSTQLVTVFGGDAEARALRESCEEATIGLAGALTADELPGARYLAIADEAGDMALALNDMRALELLTPAYLASGAPAAVLASADLVVVDANIAPDALAYVAAAVEAPILADSVSVAKAPRLIPLLPRLAALKTNLLEAERLLGDEAPVSQDGSDPTPGQRAASALARLGTDSVFLTMAEEGCAFASGDGAGTLRATGANIVDTTGAGDSFTAGVAIGLLGGLLPLEVAAVGSAIAAHTMAVERSVNPDLDLERIITDAEELLA